MNRLFVVPGAPEVRARALFCPLSGRGQPVQMPYRVLHIGTGKKYGSHFPVTILFLVTSGYHGDMISCHFHWFLFIIGAAKLRIKYFMGNRFYFIVLLQFSRMCNIPNGVAWSVVFL